MDKSLDEIISEKKSEHKSKQSSERREGRKGRGGSHRGGFGKSRRQSDRGGRNVREEYHPYDDDRRERPSVPKSGAIVKLENIRWEIESTDLEVFSVCNISAQCF